jgi:hypothetical protein
MADARVATTSYWFRFYDWPPELGGEAKPATLNTWLYIFQTHSKGARLLEEVYLEAGDKTHREAYYRTDLKHHAGQDSRPVVEAPKDSCWLDDSKRHVLEEVSYYILCSPFQLKWSRIKNLASAKDPKKFEELAAKERDLGPMVLDEESTEPGPGGLVRIKGIWSPWGIGLSLSRQYLAKLNDWSRRANTPLRQQQRTLLAAISSIRQARGPQGMMGQDGKPLLDDKFVDKLSGELVKEDQLHAEVEECAGKLVDYLKGPAMTAMEDDLIAADDLEAHEAFAAIRLAVENRLSETRVGRKYLHEWFEQRNKIVTPDVANKYKAVRKFLKMTFTWAKSWADVAAGFPSGPHKGEVQSCLVNWSKKQANLFAKENLFVVQTEPGRSRFEEKGLERLKKKVNENPWLNGFASVIDAINFAYSVRDLFDGKEGDGWTKSKKATSAVSALMSATSSAFGLLKSSTTYVSAADLAKFKNTVAGGQTAEEVAKVERWVEQGKTRQALSQLTRWKTATKWLGAFGAAADTWSSGVDLFHGLHEARTGSASDRVWLWPGLGMVGSAVTCMGYCLAFSNPAGALIVLGGTVVATAAGVGGAFWPGIASSDLDKWLMHCYVGRHRQMATTETETFTNNVELWKYHKDINLQIKALDHVLFDFVASCEFYEEHGHSRLKLQVFFRQLKAHSKVILKVFGRKGGGTWTEMGETDDWRAKAGAPPEDSRTRTRMEGPAPFYDGIPTKDFDEMKIAVQIDVLGDGTFLYPEDPREASAKK